MTHSKGQPITQSEFIEKYCSASKVTEQSLNERGRFAMPCDCEQASCEGWAMISREGLQAHLDLYLTHKGK